MAGPPIPVAMPRSTSRRVSSMARLAVVLVAEGADWDWVLGAVLIFGAR